MQLFGEILYVLFYTIWNFFKIILSLIYDLFGIPTSQYELVKYIFENNIILFNNEIITKIIMFIIPYIVSYILSFFAIKKHSKDSVVLSIVLYLLILFLFSFYQYWIFIGGVLLVVSIVILTSKIVKNIINN